MVPALVSESDTTGAQAGTLTVPAVGDTLLAMDIHLNPDVEKIVRGKLATGGYDSAADVVTEALRLLEQRDELRGKIADGLQSLRSGRGIDVDDAFRELKGRHEDYKRNQGK